MALGASSAIHVEGMRELNRALAKIDRDIAKEMRDALKEAGEPARAQAESYAFSRIGNIGPRWGRMRLGVTTSSVYIAPATRNSGGSPRPNLGTMLLDEAMLPAADEHADDTENEVLKAYDHLVFVAGFH